MHLTVDGNPGTAVAAVYDRLIYARAHTYTLVQIQTDIQLCRGLKMEPEPQNTIQSKPTNHDKKCLLVQLSYTEPERDPYKQQIWLKCAFSLELFDIEQQHSTERYNKMSALI